MEVKSKNLILVGGPMGVGKTAACNELKRMLGRCAFLDGDWCWDMHPFTVNAETKKMVMNNICTLIGSFLACSGLDNVLFCWVMHEQAAIDEIVRRCAGGASTNVKAFSLVSDEAALRARLQGDIDRGIRESDVVECALERLTHFSSLNTVKIDNTRMSTSETAQKLYEEIMR